MKKLVIVGLALFMTGCTSPLLSSQASWRGGSQSSGTSLWRAEDTRSSAVPASHVQTPEFLTIPIYR